MHFYDKAAKIGGNALRLFYPCRCPYCDEGMPKNDIDCEKCTRELTTRIFRREALKIIKKTSAEYADWRKGKEGKREKRLLCGKRRGVRGQKCTYSGRCDHDRKHP